MASCPQGLTARGSVGTWGILTENPLNNLLVGEHLLEPFSEEDPPLPEALPRVGLVVRIVDMAVVDLELLFEVDPGNWTGS